MYQGFMGKWWKIPVVSELSTLIPLELFAKITNEAFTGQGGEYTQDQNEPPNQNTVS